MQHASWGEEIIAVNYNDSTGGMESYITKYTMGDKTTTTTYDKYGKPTKSVTTDAQGKTQGSVEYTYSPTRRHQLTEALYRDDNGQPTYKIFYSLNDGEPYRYDDYENGYVKDCIQYRKQSNGTYFVQESFHLGRRSYTRYYIEHREKDKIDYYECDASGNLLPSQTDIYYAQNGRNNTNGRANG